jgi:L-arabinokinase
LTLPDAQRQYQDLVRAVDMIITKPGYGIVADAMAHQIPILYTERGEFPEYPHLVQALNELAIAELIPQRDLLSGDLEPYIIRLLGKRTDWPAASLNGADVAAEKILALLDNRSR